MELDVDILLSLYLQRKDEIQKRIKEFKETMKGSDEMIFTELCFCLCTPQSKALVCWERISNLMKNGLLYVGSENEIMRFLRGIRFKRRKARRIVDARKFFTQSDRLSIKEKLATFKNPFKLREWLVKNVNGLGMKEASHFLRNIGLGLELAILDRHILKNLRMLGIIENIPNNLSKRRYEEIEGKMKAFSEKINIPLAELDLLLWSIETGIVFK